MNETNDVDMTGVKVARAEPVKTQALALAPPLEPTDQTEGGLARFRERVKVAKEWLSLALKLTSKGQWVVMVSKDAKTGQVKESVYATAGAADRILRTGYGFRWGEKVVTVSADGQNAIARAPLIQPNGDVYETFEGRRTMGGYVHNEADLTKSAVANMYHRAVTELLGLRFLTPADFKELGLDLATLERRVDFQDHTDSKDASEVTFGFGRQKGVPISKMEDSDLAWYAEAVAKSVSDPEKVKWKAKNQEGLAAIVEEQVRRKAKADAPLVDPASETPWARIRKLCAHAGYSDEADMRKLAKSATGKSRPSDLTAEDVGKVEEALLPPEPGSQG
jgi:hypothetical protein